MNARDEDLKTPPHSDVRRERLGVAAFAVVIFAVTLAVYQPAWHGGLLWDDDAHITKTELRSAEGLRRIWFELGATQQYYPLLHSAFWLQHRLWGDDTLGYHLVNIGLHALCAVLVVLILKRLKIPGAFLAGTIFALHPVHVESVAWMTELKNTLSGSLYLGAALAYLHFDEGRRKGMYFLALALFVLALLSKTVTATLPAALLVAFWWQRGRISWYRDVLPLVPFFLLGASAGLFTVWVERTYIGAEGAGFDYTFVERCLIAGRVIWFYLGKLLWPANLIFIYPRWEISQAAWWQYLYPLGVIGLLAGLWLVRKWTRAPLAALLLFCGTLFPVLGFFNVYPFTFSFVADHFQYLASLGIITLFSAAVAALLLRWRLWPGAAAWGITLVIGLVLGVRTWQQSRIYTDSATLYAATLAGNPDCWLAHNNWGKALHEQGRIEEAVAHYQKALRIESDNAEAHTNLGLALQNMERTEEAVAHCREAIRIKPDFAGAHNNLGLALAKLGRFEEAVAHYQEALRIEADNAEAHNGWGNVLEDLGRFEEAVVHFREALRLKPDLAEAHNGWGRALGKLGRFEDAAKHCREALHLKPNHAEAHANLATALQGMRRFEEAVAHYQDALRINPELAEAHFNLGLALTRLRRVDEAVPHYQEALRIEPNLAAAHFNLGLVLSGLGQVDEAVTHYQEVLRINPDNATAHNNLGMALQGMGRPQEAVAHYQDALRIQPDHAGVHNNLAWLLSTCADAEIRDGLRALKHAQHAVRHVGEENPSVLGTLSAAYAEAGDFQQAVRWQQQAVRLAPDGQKDRFRGRLELYKQGKPFREKPQDGPFREKPQGKPLREKPQGKSDD